MLTGALRAFGLLVARDKRFDFGFVLGFTLRLVFGGSGFFGVGCGCPDPTLWSISNATALAASAARFC
jgi:hypothetical protein